MSPFAAVQLLNPPLAAVLLGLAVGLSPAGPLLFPAATGTAASFAAGTPARWASRDTPLGEKGHRPQQSKLRQARHVVCVLHLCLGALGYAPDAALPAGLVARCLPMPMAEQSSGHAGSERRTSCTARDVLGFVFFRWGLEMQVVVGALRATMDLLATLGGATLAISAVVGYSWKTSSQCVFSSRLNPLPRFAGALIPAALVGFKFAAASSP